MATAKKADARQTTMFSALDAYEALDPVIILWGDDRWADGLRELRSARWHSFDIEGYDGAPQPPRGTRIVVHEDGTAERKKAPGGGRERINIHTFIPRLLQVALPSGRVMIADLGGIRDDRAARHVQYAEFLRELQAAIYDPERLTVGHHLKFDLAVVLMRYGWRCRGARCTMLMSQLLYAGLRGVRHNLGAVCARLGIAVKKDQGRSDWTGDLSNAQYNYAGRDPLVTAKAALALGGYLREAGMRKSAEAEMLALPAFVEAEYRGMPVNQQLLKELLKLWRGIRERVVQPFLQRYPGCIPSRNKDVALRLSADPAHEGYKFYTSGTTSTGKTTIQETVGEEVLIQFDTPDRPWIGALMEWRSVGKQVEYLEQFQEKMRDGRIRTEFSQIAGGEDRSGADKEGRGMGRSGSSNVNLQNSPKLQPAHKRLGGKEVRSVCAPPPGRALLVADLSQAHARIATQASQDPTLLQIYRNGEDTHCHTASALAQLKGLPWTWQDVAKLRKQKTEEGTLAASLRDVSKPTFYGSLNLQGPTTLQRTALTSPEPVPMTLEQATEAIQAWRSKYAGLYNYQRSTVRAAAQRDIVFGGAHYAEQRTLTDRRLYLLKEPDHYSQVAATLCPQCGHVHGKLAPKPTDCVSFVWMGTEADAIKRAMGLIHLSFLAHPEWDAFIANFVHDEIDVECAYEHRYIVAAEVQRIIWECMRWAGVVDIPVDDPDAAPCHEDLARSACDETKAKNRCGRCKMIVSSWADK